MTNDQLKEVGKALLVGKEYTEEILAERDGKFGRNNKSNKRESEMIEVEIQQMEDALDVLRGEYVQDTYRERNLYNNPDVEPYRDHS